MPLPFGNANRQRHSAHGDFYGGQTTVSAYLRLQTERVNYGELIIQKTSEDGKKSGFTFKVTRDTDN